MSYAIYHDINISTPAENLFEAISDPTHLINWWPEKCSGKPQLGEVYNLFFTSEYNWYGEVVKCELNKSFHIKMTKSDPDWDSTTFGFDMVHKEKGILLKFSHTNWPECNHHFRTSSFCWALLLNGLKNYLEKGIIVPFEERS